MIEMKCCPVDHAMKYLGKKWSVQLVRDLFMGKKRFSEFLEANKELSTKMLSARLKDLEKHKIIEKRIVNKHPVSVEYVLTDKGRKLNKVLYELAIFSIEECPKQVYDEKRCRAKDVTAMARNIFMHPHERRDM